MKWNLISTWGKYSISYLIFLFLKFSELQIIKCPPTWFKNKNSNKEIANSQKKNLNSSRIILNLSLGIFLLLSFAECSPWFVAIPSPSLRPFLSPFGKRDNQVMALLIICTQIIHLHWPPAQILLLTFQTQTAKHPVHLGLAVRKNTLMLCDTPRQEGDAEALPSTTLGRRDVFA